MRKAVYMIHIFGLKDAFSTFTHCSIGLIAMVYGIFYQTKYIYTFIFVCVHTLCVRVCLHKALQSTPMLFVDFWNIFMLKTFASKIL